MPSTPEIIGNRIRKSYRLLFANWRSIVLIPFGMYWLIHYVNIFAYRFFLPRFRVREIRIENPSTGTVDQLAFPEIGYSQLLANMAWSFFSLFLTLSVLLFLGRIISKVASGKKQTSDSRDIRRFFKVYVAQYQHLALPWICFISAMFLSVFVFQNLNIPDTPISSWHEISGNFSIYTTLMAALFVIAVVFFIRQGLQLFAIPYLAANPKYSASEIIRESVRISQGRWWRIFGNMALITLVNAIFIFISLFLVSLLISITNFHLISFLNPENITTSELEAPFHPTTMIITALDLFVSTIHIGIVTIYAYFLSQEYRKEVSESSAAI